MNEQVSSAKPFGLRTFARPQKNGDILLRWHGGEGPYNSKEITTGNGMINQWKVITSKVSYDHAGLPDKNGMRRVFSIVDILPPNTICTETYLVVGCFRNRRKAENLAAFLRTRFVRFLVSQLSFSQDIFKEKFLFVPKLDMATPWTDEMLYKRYGLTKDEIAFIESKIRLMEANDS
jgi:site-specific DNA-methyltransferase (adenine-specific)